MYGGYKIIDLQNKSITGTGTVIAGVYEALEGNYGKAILVENCNINGEERTPSAFVVPKIVDDKYQFTVYGYSITIDDDDTVKAVFGDNDEYVSTKTITTTGEEVSNTITIAVADATDVLIEWRNDTQGESAGYAGVFVNGDTTTFGNVQIVNASKVCYSKLHFKVEHGLVFYEVVQGASIDTNIYSISTTMNGYGKLATSNGITEIKLVGASALPAGATITAKTNGEFPTSNVKITKKRGK